MKLLVVGAGRMGRWFARTVGGMEVAFADRDPAVAEAAAEEVGGRAVPLDTEESFDAVCIAVPISATPEAIEAHADRALSALVDVSGAMEPALEAMREAAPVRERLSLHPLFAPERAPGNVAAVFDRTGPVTGRIRGSLMASDNRVIETDAETHDRAMETVQAKAHAALLAFGVAADPVPAGFATPVLDGLVEILEAVTGNDPEVYAEIQAAFEGADEVAEAARAVAEATDDPEAFADLYAGIEPVIEAADPPGTGTPPAGGDAPDEGTHQGPDQGDPESPDDGEDPA